MKFLKFLKSAFFSLIIVGIFTLSCAVGYVAFNAYNITNNISSNNQDLGIDAHILSTIEALKNKYNYSSDEILNIALFGVDSRDISSSSNCRSDSIMIATIDTKHNKIKLSSIMRDTYVNIDGRGYDKLNHAYAYGGPELAIKTINQNFGLDIKHYVTVNFFGLEDIINSIGGIEVDVKDYEINEVNKFIKEVAKIKNTEPTLLSHSGTQRLNGMQAVSYGRIRKVGNGDYERTDRQRAIIMAMLNQSKNLNSTDILKLIPQCAKYVQTNFSIPEGIKMANNLLGKLDNISIEQKRFPVNGEGEKINGVWYMVSELSTERDLMHNFIYEN